LSRARYHRRQLLRELDERLDPMQRERLADLVAGL
jgi:hypothetical protein